MSALSAIRLDPGFALAYCNAGLALNLMHRHEEAVTYFQKALACDPSKQQIALNLSDSLLRLGRADEAVEALTIAQLKLPMPEILANLATAYYGTGDFESAERFYKEAIAGNCWLAKAHSNLAITHFYQGRFREGWAEFAWRFAADGADRRETHFPSWNGEDVTSLLVIAEQGLGEEIMWLSILPDLLARGFKVWWEADKRLHVMIKRSFPGVGVINRIGEKPIPDGFSVGAVCDAGDLGQYFRNDAASFPSRPYLCADRRSLEPFDGLTVGISWHSTNASFGPLKSQPLEAWEPLLSVPGVRFIDLQYGDHGDDARVHKVPGLDTTNDIDGVASVMASCDLIITISNTTAHLAGALGIPCWVLLAPGYGRFWYWGLGHKSLWYPNVRLFQNTAGWDGVFADARLALMAKA